MTLKHAIEKIEFYLIDTTSRYYSAEESFHGAMTVEQKAAWITKHAEEARRLAFKLRGIGDRAWDEYLYHLGLEGKTTYTIQPR